MSYQFTNNAQTTLGGSVTAGDTSLSVASASGFPTSGDFTILVGSELILVTGVAGTVFTVVRGQEGTTAAAHSTGDAVQHVLTARFLQSAAGGTSFPSSPRTNERFYRTDRGIDYFYDGTRWVSVGKSRGTFTPLVLPPFSSTPTSVAFAGAIGSGSIWITELVSMVRVATTNDASNYWQIEFFKMQPDGTGTSLYSYNTSADAANTYAAYSLPVAQEVSDATHPALVVNLTKVGSPGNLTHYSFDFVYRQVG